MMGQAQYFSPNCEARRKAGDDGLLGTSKGNRAMTTGEDDM